MAAFFTDCGALGVRCCSVMRELSCDGRSASFAPGVRDPVIDGEKRRLPLLGMDGLEVGVPAPDSEVCTTKRSEGNSLARATAIVVDCPLICN
jgi:hypothetical protein